MLDLKSRFQNMQDGELPNFIFNFCADILLISPTPPKKKFRFYWTESVLLKLDKLEKNEL